VDLQQQAVDLARKSDVAIVYANKFESEGGDLSDIDLPADQNHLISAVAQANPNTIVVLNTGSAVTMPWLDQVKGVFEAWYPGQQSGNAIAALLFGDANPSGKLPVTFPTSLAQVPASAPEQWPGVNGMVHYSEGLDVGYRWYDAHGTTPLFPFGYGLSYTSFAFSDLQLDGSVDGGTGHINVRADLTNTGQRSGAEVAQLYLSMPAGAGEPPVQLRGFAKVALRPGQTQPVHFGLTPQDASYWNSDAQAWTLVPGTYTVRVGDSSRHLPLSATFQVTHSDEPRFTKVDAPSVALPGTALTVTSAFTNASTEPVRHAMTALSVPSGWTATPQTPTAFDQVAPGQTVRTTWSVHVPGDASGGSATVSATTSYAGSGALPPAAGTAAVQVAYRSLAAAYNTVGVSDDANPAAGNLDGGGYSFSAQALASVGVTPGGTVDGFTWPNVPAGQPDAVTTSGQVVALNGAGSSLSFLAVGGFGTQQGPVTVTYTDGTTTTGTITAADWYADAAVSGCTLVVTAPYWNRPAGSTLPPDHQVSLYATSVPLAAGKQVAYIKLPNNGNLHVFAIAVG
jgi:beta-glucosidase